MRKYDFIIVSKNDRVLKRITEIVLPVDKACIYAEGLLQGVRALQSFARVQIFKYDENNAPKLVAVKG